MLYNQDDRHIKCGLQLWNNVKSKNFLETIKIKKDVCVSWNSHMITQWTQKNGNCDSDILGIRYRLKTIYSKILFKLGDIFYEDYVKIYKWVIVIARTWHFQWSTKGKWSRQHNFRTIITSGEARHFFYNLETKEQNILEKLQTHLDKEKSEKKTMEICYFDISGTAPAEFSLQHQEVKHGRKQKLGELQGFAMMERKENRDYLHLTDTALAQYWFIKYSLRTMC